MLQSTNTRMRRSTAGSRRRMPASAWRGRWCTRQRCVPLLLAAAAAACCLRSGSLQCEALSTRCWLRAAAFCPLGRDTVRRCLVLQRHGADHPEAARAPPTLDCRSATSRAASSWPRRWRTARGWSSGMCSIYKRVGGWAGCGGRMQHPAAGPWRRAAWCAWRAATGSACRMGCAVLLPSPPRPEPWHAHRHPLHVCLLASACLPSLCVQLGATASAATSSRGACSSRCSRWAFVRMLLARTANVAVLPGWPFMAACRRLTAAPSAFPPPLTTCRHAHRPLLLSPPVLLQTHPDFRQAETLLEACDKVRCVLLCKRRRRRCRRQRGRAWARAGHL